MSAALAPAMSVAAFTSLIILASLGFPAAAATAEIKVIASGAVKELLAELVPQFEKASGNKVAVTSSSTVKMREQVSGSETFDLVIGGVSLIEALDKDGVLRAGSRLDIVKSGVGVAVKSGAPKIDISSGAAVKRALLAAKSVSFSVGPSGVYILKLFDTMGIAEQMKAKAKQTPPGTRVGQYLAECKAEIGFQQVSELIHEKGIDFLGPLPADIQEITIFSSAIPARSAAAEAARALQSFLTNPAAVAVIKKNGLEPAQP